MTKLKDEIENYLQQITDLQETVHELQVNNFVLIF